MQSLCGIDCCSKCSHKNTCGGCTQTDGRPFGGRGRCIAAECIKNQSPEAFSALKQTLIEEFNALGLPGLQIGDLNLLNGFYINLEYQLPNGQSVKLLEDENTYLGNQVEKPGSERCYGLAADEHYLLVCEYGCNGSSPEILIYKKRQSAAPSLHTTSL